MTDDSTTDRQLRAVRIILLAFVRGDLLAGATLAGLRFGGLVAPRPTPVLTHYAVAFAVLSLVFAYWLPRKKMAEWRRVVAYGNLADKAEEWLFQYRQQMILALALLEGAALMQSLAFFLDGLVLSLGVDAALLVVMVLWYPTRPGVESWIAAQGEQVELLKQDRV
jgi:hypothetical protein